MPDAVIQHSLERVVRRVLRSGRSTSPLSRRILEIRRAIMASWPDATTAGSQRICRAIVDQIAHQLQHAPDTQWPAETWTHARAVTAVLPS